MSMETILFISILWDCLDSRLAWPASFWMFFFSGKRQRDDKRGTHAWPTLNRNVSLMILEDAIGNREP